MKEKTTALVVDGDAPGVSGPEAEEGERNEAASRARPKKLDTPLRRAVGLFSPDARRGNAKILCVRIKLGGDIIITEAEPPQELVEAIEQQVLAEARARVIQALTPTPAPVRPVRKAPPPVPTKPVSDADRERARKALTRVGIHVRPGDKS